MMRTAHNTTTDSDASVDLQHPVDTAPAVTDFDEQFTTPKALSVVVAAAARVTVSRFSLHAHRGQPRWHQLISNY